jgi:hypothetical protein
MASKKSRGSEPKGRGRSEGEAPLQLARAGGRRPEWGEKRARPDDPPRTGTSSDASRARFQQIQVRAYFKAQHRGFAPGLELQDWLSAEQDVEVAS